MSGTTIYGNWGTLLLPINTDESIDYGRLSAEIDELILAGVNGIYSNGTAGEFYNICEQEFDIVNTVLAKKCHAAGMPFQIGVSHMSPILSLNRLKRSLTLAPDAVQVILPDWFKVTNQEATTFLQRMAETAGDMAIVLYNPPHAKRNLTPEEFGLLKSRIPTLSGIKVAGGDDGWYRDIKKYCPGLSIFVAGHHMASGCLRGAHGAYSNMACLNPFAAQKWYDTIAADVEEALDMEKRINVFLSKYMLPLISDQHYANQAVDKCMALIGGWSNIGTRLRWPYRWIPEDYALSLREEARKILPEFFETKSGIGVNKVTSQKRT